MTRRLAFFSAFALVSMLSLPALAFCPATTCNLGDPNAGCRRNSDGCETTGKPLFWASECVSFAVQASGSVKLGISAQSLERELERAFIHWTEATCAGGAAPRLTFASLGNVECGLSEYNSERANANIVLFEDDEWPYEGGIDTLATTRLRFDPNTGALYDADIQLNSAEFEFSVGDPVTASDLASVLAHEIGHFLGLSHTQIAGATMETGYDATDDLRRSLEPDDLNGICAIHPPDRAPSSESCTPRHGFSGQCGEDQPPPEVKESSGCAFQTPERTSPLGALVVAFALTATCGLRRRLRMRPS